MSLKARFKKRRGLIFSILFHLLLFFGLFHALNNDKVTLNNDKATLPTSSVGYQVELVHSQDSPRSLPPATKLPPLTPSSTDKLVSSSKPNSKADINLKVNDSAKTLTPEQSAAKKKAFERRKMERAKLRAQKSAYRKQQAQAKADQAQKVATRKK